MPHSCGDFDVPVISVCGTKILMETFDIQKLIVYLTDLDEKHTSRTRKMPSTRTNRQIEDWNKKLNLLRFAAYAFGVGLGIFQTCLPIGGGRKFQPSASEFPPSRW